MNTHDYPNPTRRPLGEATGVRVRVLLAGDIACSVTVHDNQPAELSSLSVRTGGALLYIHSAPALIALDLLWAQAEALEPSVLPVKARPELAPGEPYSRAVAAVTLTAGVPVGLRAHDPADGRPGRLQVAAGPVTWEVQDLHALRLAVETWQYAAQHRVQVFPHRPSQGRGQRDEHPTPH